MNTTCSYRAFGSCLCSVKCLSETAHIQIIVDRAPIIRPFPKRPIALFGFIAAMVGMLAMYGLGSRLDEHFRVADLDNRESGVIVWKR